MSFTECSDKADKFNTITDFSILNVFVESVNTADIFSYGIYGPSYDLFGPVRNAVDAGKSIARASGRGVLGPVKWHRAVRQVSFWAQKSIDSMAQPPSTCPSNGFARIKSITYMIQGHINQRSTGSFMYMSFQGP